MSLGSIVVRLTMNTADFETDAGRASKVAQRRAKEIDDSFRKAGKAIGIALGSAATAAVAGTVYALNSAIEKMDETYNAAKKVGDSTENFSRLTYAAGLADLGMDQLVTTLGKLTKSQAAALDVTSEQSKLFKALGIDVVDASGKLRGSTEVMLDFADQFAAMKGSPEAMAAGFSIFGRSFQDLIPLLEQGSGEIRRLMEEADTLGITLSDSAGAAADQFRDDLDKLKGAVNGVWKEVATGMLPAMDEATVRLTQLAADGDTARNMATLLSAALNFGVGALDAYNNAVARTSIAIEMFAESMAGAWEIQKNLLSLGFADGSIASGFQRQADAMTNGQKQLDKLIADRELSKAGMTRSQYNDRLAGQFNLGLPGSFSMAPAPAGFNFAADQAARKPAAAPDARAVRLALGGESRTPKSGGGAKPRKEEISEEAKAMERLNEQATRELETLRGRLGLMGLETEAAKMKWETEEGSFKALDPLRKAELVALAALTDAKLKSLDIAAEEKQAAEDAQRGYEDAIRAIREEAETLGMSNDQLEIYNRLKAAGTGITDAMRQAIVAETEMLQQQRQAMDDQIQLLDGLRDSANGFFDDLSRGVSVWDALSNAANNFADILFDMASKKLVEQIFGMQGSGGGGGLGDLFGSLLGSLFGGGGSSGSSGGGGQFGWVGNGYSTGGWTGPGGMNQPAGIVHADEVVWSKGDVARAGGVAAVEAMRRGGMGRGGVQQNISFLLQGDMTHQTQTQVAQKAGMAAQTALARA